LIKGSVFGEGPNDLLPVSGKDEGTRHGLGSRTGKGLEQKVYEKKLPATQRRLVSPAHYFHVLKKRASRQNWSIFVLRKDFTGERTVGSSWTSGSMLPKGQVNKHKYERIMRKEGGGYGDRGALIKKDCP